MSVWVAVEVYIDVVCGACKLFVVCGGSKLARHGAVDLAQLTFFFG